MPGGRPAKYDPNYHPEIAEKLCRAGVIDEQLADFFDVHVATIYRWKNTYPEFRKALWRGKAIADAKVAEALFRCAAGYEYEIEKIFCTRRGKIVRVKTTVHRPPNTTAALFWLANRLPHLWGRTRMSASDGTRLTGSAQHLQTHSGATLAPVVTIIDQTRTV